MKKQITLFLLALLMCAVTLPAAAYRSNIQFFNVQSPKDAVRHWVNPLAAATPTPAPANDGTFYDEVASFMDYCKAAILESGVAFSYSYSRANDVKIVYNCTHDGSSIGAGSGESKWVFRSEENSKAIKSVAVICPEKKTADVLVYAAVLAAELAEGKYVSQDFVDYCYSVLEEVDSLESYMVINYTKFDNCNIEFSYPKSFETPNVYQVIITFK